MSRKYIHMPVKEKSDFYESLVHLIFWIVVVLFPIINELIGVDGSHDGFQWGHVVEWWVGTIPFLILFLLHNYILLPFLLFKKKTMMYIATALLLLVSFGIYQYIDFKDNHPLQRRTEVSIAQGVEAEECAKSTELEHIGPKEKYFIPMPVVVNLLMAFSLLGFNICVVLLFRYHREQDRIHELEKARLQDELKYLKAQVNPHFFMNMLNNIHGMIETDSKKAQKSIIELSNLMRFVLYDSANPLVTLNEEEKFLRNYLCLKRQSYPENKVVISFDVEFGNCGDKKIPPLLFIPFIENAFKHGISYRKLSEVAISMHQVGNRLFFTCRNTKPAVAAKQKDGKGGVGLANIRRRLDLLYEGKYELEILNEDKEYKVKLIIPFTND